MNETERDELFAAARQIEVQDAACGRLFARIIAWLPAAPAAAVAPATPETPLAHEAGDTPDASQEG